MARASRKTVPHTSAPRAALPPDWARVDATTDAEITQQIAEDPDTAPDLTEAVTAGWLTAVEPAARPRKTSIALRVDPQVLAFFKRGGSGYQRRMNAVLQAYVQHHQAAASSDARADG